MSNNITKLDSFFKETKKFSIGEKIYVVNESSEQYIKFKAKMKELQETKAEDQDDMELMEYCFELAFGEDKAKEILEFELDGVKIPMSALRQLFNGVIEAWTGQDTSSIPQDAVPSGE